MTSTIAIVIPTYNEASNIETLLDRIIASVPEAYIIIVDDNSPDKTWRLVEKRSVLNPRVILLKGEKKNGLADAYRRGFRRALEIPSHVDVIVQMDGDLSHRPEVIFELAELSKNYDLVIGSRYTKGINVINWPLSRILLSYFANAYIKRVTGLPIHDSTSGFKCFRRKSIEKLNFDKLKSNGYVFQVEVNYLIQKAGFNIFEHSIVFMDRASGFSKMRLSIIIEAFIKVLFLRFRKVKRYFNF